MTWTQFNSGTSIGTQGSEDGTIVADYEHELGARITIERDGCFAPFAITCGIYGWFFHTCFLSSGEEADSACMAMQSEMDTIIRSIPLTTDTDYDAKSAGVTDAISNFVDTFG